MSQITKRIAIHAPAGRAWDVLADFGAAEKWAPTVVESHCSTPARRGSGARRMLTTSTGEVTEELVTAWDEGHGFTFEIPAGLGSVVKTLAETWSVQPLPQGSEVAVVMDYRMKDGILNSILDALVVRRKLESMLVQNLAGLKYHVETGERVTSRMANLPVDAVR